MADQQAKQKVSELIREAKIGMLTTMTKEGAHHSRPMAMQEIDFDGELWFFTYEDSHKVHDISTQPGVNISFSNKGANSWVSIAGTAAVVHDKDKIKELWNPLLKAWFPDGIDTKGIALLRVEAESAEYWDAPHGAVVQLFGMAKAALTGTTPNVGDNHTVDLDK